MTIMPQAKRPPLPTRHANQYIKNIRTLPPVKYQVLNCQGNDILVGRMKIDTPTSTGHAFILRRFDTNAISLTTMFRAAFPNASDQEEKDEVQWVKDAYDLTGNNGSSKDTSITRLAGTWVSPRVALELGKAYMLGDIITTVVQAQPDPSINYRRSGKGQLTPKASTNVLVSTEVVETVQLSTKASNAAASSASSPEQKPTKRRREASAVPEPSPPKIKTSVSVEEKSQPRRSTRTRSPPPKVPPSTSMIAVANKVASGSPTKTPSKRSTRRAVKQEEAPVTPGGSEETAYEEREDETQAADDIAGSQLHEQDIAEQKDLIADLKRKREEALKNEDAEMDDSETLKNKRAREDENQKLRFDFKEPEVGERAIATNRRILGQLLEEPRRRSLAWGVAAFVFGAGAVTLLPNFL
ncbi:hypothetical protein E1B28_011287 [Marasmius oreades]|uniref:HTH APSES-type domain-containing protein n=1 Tax=Marasmius oreades TaxID=181124 RepID=A0A9P7RTR7_9AGAR|nr:uncharacterized protein E1B28_011287 [Marasmius oreades]KAG7089621.1 hypothetical protein E1B28_011287 [Marasmius oreades]